MYQMPQRLSKQDAETLWSREDPFSLGRMAHEMRMAIHPRPVVTYIVDRNINYTNVCVSKCRFCAFYRSEGHPEAYVLDRDELAGKVEETVALGGYQILLQGGMHPGLDLEFYTGMLTDLKTRFPDLAVHGFSPSEIVFLAKRSGCSTAEIIAELKAAGLDSIPGGGAEILVDRVRQEVSPTKCTAEEWLAVMAEAHRQSMRTTATMMFGHVERFEERIEHLERIRRLQDETGGFTAFIPWTFQPGNSRIEVAEASSVEYLKFLALCRLYLDNVPNLQVSWVTQGPHVGQIGLFFGANDFGSTMIEENVVAAAGVSFRMPEEQMRRLIERGGFEPRRRRMDYSLRE
jgi:cyclic dehypoxanthinyl futalosine synthase